MCNLVGCQLARYLARSGGAHLQERRPLVTPTLALIVLVVAFGCVAVPCYYTGLVFFGMYYNRGLHV